MTKKERDDYLRRKGYNPDEYELITWEELAQKRGDEMPWYEAGWEGFKEHAGATVGGGLALAGAFAAGPTAGLSAALVL